MKTKLDFPQTPASQRLLKIFKKWLRKEYGPRCKTKAAQCHTCVLYSIYDVLEIHLP